MIRTIKKALICMKSGRGKMNYWTCLNWYDNVLCLNLVPTPPHFSLMSRPNTEFTILLPQHLLAWELHWPSWSLWLFLSETWSLDQLLHLSVALLVCVVLSLESQKSWLIKQASNGSTMVSTHCIHMFKSIFIYIHIQLVHSIRFVVIA